MEVSWVYCLFAMTLAYLCGSIPTAVWWGKAFHSVDIREHGSRNAGATNTFRVLGARAGVPVLLIDILKGFAPVRVLPIWSGAEPGSDAWTLLRVLLVIAAVVGHLYPVFAQFRGGKGIATSLGGILAIHPGAAVVCVGVFTIVFLLSRYVSLSSLVAALCYPIAVLFIYQEDSRVLLYFSIGMFLLVLFTHRENIGRLWRGEENRMRLAGQGTNNERS